MLDGLLTCWMVLEAMYFPYWLATFRRLSKRSPPMNSCKSQVERCELLSKCLAASKLASAADNDEVFEVYREWFLRWFLREDSSAVKLHQLRRGNVDEWVAWAFFDLSLNEITSLSDLRDLVDKIEDALKVKFPSGHNPKTRCIRLTIDKVHATQRPLVYYWAISLLLALGKAGLYLLGYSQRIVQRKAGLLSAETLGTVFYRPATNAAADNTAPIVFCHGLGVGYVHYLLMLWRLPTTSPVYLLDFPNITMTLGAETMPSVSDTTLLVKAMLEADGFKSACFVAHSFGTICVSWLLNSKDANIRSLVKSCVLIDPISLMLFDPAVAFNFVHRRPSNSVQIMMSYFVSQELYIAHTLARMFSWSHASLFLDDVPEHVRVEVVLSGDDAIVPAKLVRAYVDQHQRTHNAAKGKAALPCSNTIGRCLWFDQVHHGQLMLYEQYIRAILESIRVCL